MRQEGRLGVLLGPDVLPGPVQMVALVIFRSADVRHLLTFRQPAYWQANLEAPTVG